MDPRIGKANYGEKYRKLLQPDVSEADHLILTPNQKLTKYNVHNATSVPNNVNNFHHMNKSSHNVNKYSDITIHKNKIDMEKDNANKNYRLVVDPNLIPNAKRVISYDGIIHGVSEPIILRDPRSRTSRFKKDSIDLVLPKFKYDEHSVGTILPKEVSFFNLNNNVDKSFLTNLCKFAGTIEDVKIYYHPISKKHLGIGSVLFTSTKAAKSCCDKLHKTTSMGNVMNVIIDIRGLQREKVINELTSTTSSKMTISSINPATTTTMMNINPSLSRPQSSSNNNTITYNNNTSSDSAAFKSPSPNKLTRNNSNNNLTLHNTNNIQQQHTPTMSTECSSNNCLNGNSAKTTEATTPQAINLEVLPTPPYTDPGYYSCRHSDTSEQTSSLGGDSVGSGNIITSIVTTSNTSNKEDGLKISYSDSKSKTKIDEKSHRSFKESHRDINLKSSDSVYCSNDENSRSPNANRGKHTKSSKVYDDNAYHHHRHHSLHYQQQQQYNKASPEYYYDKLKTVNQTHSTRHHHKHSYGDDNDSDRALFSKFKSYEDGDRMVLSKNRSYDDDDNRMILNKNRSYDYVNSKHYYDHCSEDKYDKYMHHYYDSKYDYYNEKVYEKVHSKKYEMVENYHTSSSSSSSHNKKSEKRSSHECYEDRNHRHHHKHVKDDNKYSKNCDNSKSYKSHKSSSPSSSRHKLKDKSIIIIDDDDDDDDDINHHKHHSYNKRKNDRMDSKSRRESEKKYRSPSKDTMDNSTINSTDKQHHNSKVSINVDDSKGSNKNFDSPPMSLESRIQAMLNQDNPLSKMADISPDKNLQSINNDKKYEKNTPDENLNVIKIQKVEEEEDEINNNNSGDDDDDRMSMSSSDGDKKLDVIEVNVPVKETSKVKAPLLTKWPPPSSTVMPYYSLHHPPHHNFQHHHHPYVAQPLMSIYPHNLIYQQIQQQQHSSTKNQAPNNLDQEFVDAYSTVASKEESRKFQKVLKAVVDELQLVISKDLRRRMVENTGFKVFNEWWIENAPCDKKLGSNLLNNNRNLSNNNLAYNNTNNQVTTPSTFKATTTKESSSSVLNFLFENHDSDDRGMFGGGGLLGLRGAIAKMPSFRKKYIPPTPPPTVEADDDDDEEEVVDDSAADSEKEESVEENEEEEDNEEEEEEDEIEPQKVKFKSSFSEDENDDEELEQHVSRQRSRVRAIHDSNDEDADYDDDDEIDNSKRQDEDDDDGSVSGGTMMASDDDDDQSIRSQLSDYDNDDVKNVLGSGEEHENNYEVNEANDLLPLEQPSSQSTLSDDNYEKEDFSNLDDDDDLINPPCSKEIDEISQESSFSSRKRHRSNDENIDDGTKIESKKLKTVTATFVPLSSSSSTVSSSSPALSSSSLLHSAAASPLSSSSLSSSSCRLFFPSGTSKPCHPKKFQAYPNYSDNSDQKQESMHGLADVTNKIKANFAHPQPQISLPKNFSSRELKRLQCSLTPSFLSSYITSKPVVQKVKFIPRDYGLESDILECYLKMGIDAEDIDYLMKSYEMLLQTDYPQTYWLNDTHWFEHPATYVPQQQPVLSARNNHRKKKKIEQTIEETFETKHKTGSARTEGYYKISHLEKSGYLQHARGVQEQQVNNNRPNELEQSCNSNTNIVGGDLKKKVQQQLREARSESRRWQSVLTSLGEDLGELLKFNHLKFRKKQLKFAKSGIHDWGLFALERIQEGEMVIEYVGQVVRQPIADIREKRYEALGIGSSYLFRIDGEAIVDATKYGNLARFINHSCTPNCCAKIVTVDSLKKIVIYSRKDIEVNEEITYDYKFPIEDNKIPCLCGSSGCRGTLN